MIRNVFEEKKINIEINIESLCVFIGNEIYSISSLFLQCMA